MPHHPPLIEPLESRSLLSATPSATGSLRGGVFIDQNLNGVNDAGDEAPDGEITLYLDANNNDQHDLGERSTYPMFDGRYHFSHVTPGTYHLRELFDFGYSTSVPDGYTIHIHAGKTLVRWLPVNPGAQVTGTFFIDTNADGVQDDGEQPLEIAGDGVQPAFYFATQITSPPSQQRQRTTTSGTYAVTAIPPGTYHLHVIRAAYHYTTPIDVVLTVKAGQMITQNFGIRPPVPM